MLWLRRLGAESVTVVGVVVWCVVVLCCCGVRNSEWFVWKRGRRACVLYTCVFHICVFHKWACYIFLFYTVYECFLNVCISYLSGFYMTVCFIFVCFIVVSGSFSGFYI